MQTPTLEGFSVLLLQYIQLLLMLHVALPWHLESK